MKKTITILSFGLLMPMAAVANGENHLAACWKKQVQSLGDSYISFSYDENKHEIAHLSEPWETYHASTQGTIWCNGDNLLKIDSVGKPGNRYCSKTQFSIADSVLLYLGYGEKEISKATRSMIADEPVDEARFSPMLLISYFHAHEADARTEDAKKFAIYSLKINNSIVSLFIRKKDNLLAKATTFTHEDLYGDVTSTITYSGFKEPDKVPYPSLIYIDKVNGKAKDTVTISSVSILKIVQPLLDRPADYKLAAEREKPRPEISIEKYSDNIHFVTLKHTNGRSMIVEFKDYLLVAEAPLSSENGEMIITEARKIAPGKPIKYFIFCHYHPDYIGGIRAFIHKGATVLCTEGDVAYINYLASALHTLKPDSLELQPRKVKTEDIGSHKTCSDGNEEMDIYLIGSKSEHTKDYLIYYFPKEKMIFEGDLAWISEKGPVKKAGKRQAGLYNAIKDLKLNVTIIEQSWPVGSYGVKSEIPFTEMEQAMNVK